jgi:uncharacterized iron-regulated membrane protein
MRGARFLIIHRWLGLALAPFLMVQALTGAVLVVHELTLPAPAATNPAGTGTAPASALIAAAQQARPAFHVRRLYLPGSTGRTAFAEMATTAGATAYAELDPASARSLDAGALWRFPFRAAVQVHYRLADGTFGMIMVLITGVALVLAALSGLIHWWPGRNRVVQALRVRRGLPARLRLRQWHRTVGAAASALALLSGATGVLLIAPDLMPVPAGTTTAPPPAPSAAQVDAAVAAARARFPGASVRDLRLPPADRIDINLDAPGRNARAVHAVSVRLSDMVVTRAVAAQENPALWMKVLYFHTGEAVPWAGPLLLLGEAGALAFLAWAGTKMWFNTGRKAK